jgi:hypothetical protein
MVPVNKFFPKYHHVLINNLVLFFIRRFFNLHNLWILCCFTPHRWSGDHSFAPPARRWRKIAITFYAGDIQRNTYGFQPGVITSVPHCFCVNARQVTRCMHRHWMALALTTCTTCQAHAVDHFCPVAWKRRPIPPYGRFFLKGDPCIKLFLLKGVLCQHFGLFFL